MGVVYLAGSTMFFELSSRSCGFSLFLVPRSCLQSSFLQLHFQGSGVFTDEWAMVLAATIRVCPLLVIVFLLISENYTVLESVTGRSCVACSVRTVSASDVVLRICFGVLWPLSSLWFLPHCDEVPWLSGLNCSSMTGLLFRGWFAAVLRGCPTTGALRWLSVPIVRGLFLPLRCDGDSHRSILWSWDDLLDHVFASFALIKVVPIILCPLTIIWHLWLLGGHRGHGFQILGLDFSSFSNFS